MIVVVLLIALTLMPLSPMMLLHVTVAGAWSGVCGLGDEGCAINTQFGGSGPLSSVFVDFNTSAMSRFSLPPEVGIDGQLCV